MKIETFTTDASETILMELTMNSDTDTEQAIKLQRSIDSLLPSSGSGWVRVIAAPLGRFIIAANTGLPNYVAQRRGDLTSDDLPMLVLHGLAKSGLVRFHGNRETGSYDSWAWPGGRPIGYITNDGEILCADCLNQDADYFLESMDPQHETGGWFITGVTILESGEDEDLVHCAGCNKDMQ